jgi:hypothetical protein
MATHDMDIYIRKSRRHATAGMTWYGHLRKEKQKTCNCRYDNRCNSYTWTTSFLSHNLVNDLTKKKISCCGTVIPNRKECYRVLLFCISFNFPFNPEDGSRTFLWNITGRLLGYISLHPRRQYSSKALLFDPSILKMERVRYCKLLVHFN